MLGTVVRDLQNAGPPRGRVPELLLQWHVTERCNFRCAHCYQDEYIGQELRFEEMLGVVEQFKCLLHRLAAERGGAPPWGHISVTGGEPFVSEGFLPLLEVLGAERDTYTFAILTNGSLIDDTLAARLKELGPWFVQVSMDGDRALNDRLRAPGAFEGAVAALRRLGRAGVRTVVSFTAQRQNYRAFPEVARVGRQLGVSRVWADRLIPAGQGAALSDDLLTPEETREFFRIMRQARAEGLRTFSRTEIRLGRALQFLVGGGRPYRCGAGDNLLTLLPNGDVYPCRRMPIKVGNVRERSLEDIYFSHPLLLSLRERSHPNVGCEECRHAPTCGGGLRCLAYAMTGNPFNADPGCWHARSPEGGQASAASARPSVSAVLPEDSPQ